MTAEHVECRDLPGSQECVEKISPLFMVAELLDSQEFRISLRTFGLSSGASEQKSSDQFRGNSV